MFGGDIRGGSVRQAGLVVANTLGTTVSLGTDAKGAYAQLTAATAFATDAMLVVINTEAGDGSLKLIDISVGAAGSEVVIAPNLLYSNVSLIQDIGLYWLPVHIPAGSRIAARGRSPSANGVARVMVQLIATQMGCMTSRERVLSYGISGSDGTSVDPGGTAHTKGAWVQLTGSTGAAVRALVLGTSHQNNTTRDDALWLLDIGVGPAGSENVVAANLMLTAESGSDLVSPPVIGPIFLNIPAGARIAARLQSSITGAADRTLALAAYGAS